MTIDAQSPPGAPPPPDKQNVFSRIAGVLFAPAETFASIARRPDIVGPLLVILILGYASTFLIMPKMDWESIRSMQAEQFRKQNPNVSNEQLEQMEKFGIASAKVGTWVAPIVFVAWYAIIAGALLLAFRVFGGQGTFKQAFSATLYSWMPMVLFGIILTIVILARGTFDPITAATLVKSNPGFLVDMMKEPVLFSLLTALDIFVIWMVALLVIGFAALTNTPIGKSAAIVVSLWIVFIVIKLGFAAMNAARMKG